MACLAFQCLKIHLETDLQASLLLKALCGDLPVVKEYFQIALVSDLFAVLLHFQAGVCFALSELQTLCNMTSQST